MKKVMLVDDEDIVLQDMRTLIDWESNGYCIVAAANDSDKALELFREYLPDIVFVDIRIPQTNGLDLSRKILAIKKNTKIHILTAYRDFDYARTAMDIGVFSYQLKHTINKDSLLAILNKTSEMIEREEEETRNLKRQMILESIGEGYSRPETGFYGREDFLGEYGNRFALLYLKPDRSFPVVEEEKPRETTDKWEPFRNRIPLPSEFILVDTIETKQDSILIVLGFNDAYGHGETCGIIHSAADTLRRTLQEKEETSFTIAFLEGWISFGELKRGFRLLKEAMLHGVFFGKNAVVAADRVEFEKPCRDVNRHLNELYYNRHSWDCSQMVREMETAFHTIMEARNINELRNLCKKLNILLTLLYDEKCHYTIEMCYEKWMNDREEWYSAESILKWYKNEFEFVLAAGKKLSNPSPLIQNVLKYIHKNYMNPINPNDIAAIFGMNGTYLGQKFKKETGQTFLDYLTDYRIEVAKILLKSGRYKVYEVSEKVGYKTSQYFSSVFKEATGTTPQEFR